MQIKKEFNEDFENLCDLFVDNKLSIHSGDDKTISLQINREQRISVN